MVPYIVSTSAPAPERFEAVNRRLQNVAHNLVAVHQMCSAAQCNREDTESILQLIRETVRGSARAIDACLRVLDSSPAIGCFDDDLEDF